MGTKTRGSNLTAQSSGGSNVRKILSLCGGHCGSCGFGQTYAQAKITLHGFMVIPPAPIKFKRAAMMVASP